MARRRRAEKREVIPDAKYGSVNISKFVNNIMKGGKKSLAEKIVYGALDSLAKQTNVSVIESFDQSLENVRPSMEVRSRRIGGATYQVPVEVRDLRSIALSLRWIVASAASRGEKTMQDKLAAELFEAFSGRGAAVKKRDDNQKMADANKAFAHYKI